MNIKEFANNPSGRGSSMVGSRSILKDAYNRKYTKYLKENGSIKTELYYNKKQDKYYILSKIKSETVKGIEYDVVIEFSDGGKEGLSKANTILPYDISIFSSCPSYVFTYASASIHNKMAIKELISKYPKEIKKVKADTRNPNLIMGFEKSSYYAISNILSHPVMFNKSNFLENGKSLNKLLRKIDSYVTSFDDINSKRSKLLAIENKKKKKVKIIDKKVKDKITSNSKNPNASKRSVKVIKPKAKIGSKSKKIKSKKKI